jgi:hypothetical protein
MQVKGGWGEDLERDMPVAAATALPSHAGGSLPRVMQVSQFAPSMRAPCARAAEHTPFLMAIGACGAVKARQPAHKLVLFRHWTAAVRLECPRPRRRAHARHTLRLRAPSAVLKPGIPRFLRSHPSVPLPLSEMSRAGGSLQTTTDIALCISSRLPACWNATTGRPDGCPFRLTFVPDSLASHVFAQRFLGPESSPPGVRYVRVDPSSPTPPPLLLGPQPLRVEPPADYNSPARVTPLSSAKSPGGTGKLSRSDVADATLARLARRPLVGTPTAKVKAERMRDYRMLEAACRRAGRAAHAGTFSFNQVCARVAALFLYEAGSGSVTSCCLLARIGSPLDQDKTHACCFGFLTPHVSCSRAKHAFGLLSPPPSHFDALPPRW